jgi:glycine cleavage system aminomethyltransferase T
VIGLAVIEKAHAEKGTRLEVTLGDRSARATVGDCPIYDPSKRRPRG